MDKRTIIVQEAKEWEKAGIITAEQREQITARYPVKTAGSSLPILAAILIALGILTFIASNWSGIAPAGKLAIIFLALIGAYLAGDRLRQKGYARLGSALTIVGIAIYGAGFFLIGQMYHLSGNPMVAFYFWFLGAITLTWHYKEKVLFVTSLLILIVSALYGESYGVRSGLSVCFYYLFILVGIFPFLWKFRTPTLASVAISVILLIAIIDVSSWDEGVAIPLLFLLCLVIARLLPETPRYEPFPLVLASVGYLATFLYSVVMVFAGAVFFVREGPGYPFITLLIALTAVYAFLVVRRKRPDLVADCAPFVAIALIALIGERVETVGQSVIQLAALFVFSCGMILGGERTRDVLRINLGAVLFGLTCFVGYVNLAWDFMDKSLFFLLGGILLLALSIFLERKRRKWVEGARRT